MGQCERGGHAKKPYGVLDARGSRLPPTAKMDCTALRRVNLLFFIWYSFPCMVQFGTWGRGTGLEEKETWILQGEEKSKKATQILLQEPPGLRRGCRYKMVHGVKDKATFREESGAGGS